MRIPRAIHRQDGVRAYWRQVVASILKNLAAWTIFLFVCQFPSFTNDWEESVLRKKKKKKGRGHLCEAVDTKKDYRRGSHGQQGQDSIGSQKVSGVDRSNCVLFLVQTNGREHNRLMASVFFGFNAFFLCGRQQSFLILFLL